MAHCKTRQQVSLVRLQCTTAIQGCNTRLQVSVTRCLCTTVTHRTTQGCKCLSSDVHIQLQHTLQHSAASNHRQLFLCRTTHSSTLQHTVTHSGCNALQHRAASGSCRLSTWQTARQGSNCLSSDGNVPLQYRAATHGCKCLSSDVYVPL